MNTAEFLIDLRAKGIVLWSDDNDTLRYRGPKGAVTAEIRSQLAERKIEILALLGQTSADSSLLHSPFWDSTPGLSPLSYAEESLWLLNQIKPGSAWNMQSSYRLRGS